MLSPPNFKLRLESVTTLVGVRLLLWDYGKEREAATIDLPVSGVKK